MPLFRFLQGEGHSTAWKLTLKTIEPEAHRSEKGPVRKKFFIQHLIEFFYFILFKLGRLMRLQHGRAPLLAGEKEEKNL